MKRRRFLERAGRALAGAFGVAAGVFSRRTPAAAPGFDEADFTWSSAPGKDASIGATVLWDDGETVQRKMFVIDGQGRIIQGE